MQVRVQQVLDRLRKQNGLYVASPSSTYEYIWIRDNCYIALSELDTENGWYEQTYHSLLDIFRRYEWKLSYHALHRPVEVYEYIHPRYTADSLLEVWRPWGNAQNDAIGAFLFGIGQGMRIGLPMVRDETDFRIISLLIKYLSTLEFWQDEDNGIWEENRELHASSIGACVAGLMSVRPYFDVDITLIRNGLHALFDLLPRESALHESDLALLSLIYPYHLLPHMLAREIVENVEQQLLRTHGVIRYRGDKYYSENNQEAEWCMGLPWLGLCHLHLGHEAMAERYLIRAQQVMREDGALPELYLPEQQTPNENTPLGWSNALYLLLERTLTCSRKAREVFVSDGAK